MVRATRMGLLAQKLVVPAARRTLASRSTWVTPRVQTIGTPGEVARAALPAWGSVGGFLGASGLGARRSPRFEQVRYHGDDHGHSHGEVFDTPKVGIKFIYEKDGSVLPATGRVGMNVLRVAHASNIDLEGACECSLACSTCHVVLEEKLYDTLEEPTDEENDMLDLAFALTETSRLGCQVILTEAMEGATFIIPSATRNMYVDGHVPKPH